MLTCRIFDGVFCVLFCMLALTAMAETVKVAAVPEGDVVSVEREGGTADIRLYGIDCPEPGQPGAEEAVAFVKERVLDKEAAIEVLATDSEDKPVVRLTYGEADKNLAEELAAAGLAWWDQRNAKQARNIKTRAAEAIVAEKGIWQAAAPLAPWDYRLSKGIEPFTYKVEPESESVPGAQAPADAGGAEEEAAANKSLKLKGDAQYTGNRGPVVDFEDVKVDPNELMMKHAPHIAKDDSGKALGVTANDISSLPYAAQLGFQDGDIISSVNGNAIRNEADAFALVNKLKNQKNFSVKVIRNGKPVDINFRIP